MSALVDPFVIVIFASINNNNREFLNLFGVPKDFGNNCMALCEVHFWNNKLLPPQGSDIDECLKALSRSNK